MRVCINKLTGKLIESQSGGDQLPSEQIKKLITDWYYSKYGKWYSPTRSLDELLAEFKPEVDAAIREYGQGQLDTLRQNAINAGHLEADIEVKFVTDEEYQAIIEAEKPEPTYADLRRAEYPSTHDMTVALWEDIVEGRPEARIALQELRTAIKAKYPKS